MNVVLNPTGHALELTRELAAPRERVFAAWTDPDQAARWWMPREWTLVSCRMDVRPGGGWHRRMRGRDGSVIAKWGEYREIVAPERLVFTYNTEFADGTVEPETVVTVTFEDLGGRTRLVLRHEAFQSEAASLSHTGGWTGAVDRLGNHLSARSTTMNVQPYLYFDGRSEEAIEFYKGAIGAKVEMLMHFSDMPGDKSMITPGSEGKVMHACIKVGDSPIYLSDGNCRDKPTFSGITLTINATSDAEADKLFAALGQGGQIQMPIAETFFATRFGMVADKFGVSWMVLHSKPMG